eukprot:419781_1
MLSVSVFLLFSITRTTSQTTVTFIQPIVSELKYDGPVTLEYFQTAINMSSIYKFPEISCHQHVYFGQTNESHVVAYYRLNITSRMKSLYTAGLSLSTCCEFVECGYTYETLYESMQAEFKEVDRVSWLKNMTREEFEAAYDINFFNEFKRDCNQWFFAYNHGDITDYHEHYTNSTMYRNYCVKDTSLDTILYVLYEKKGKINLRHISDDVNQLYCNENKEKSHVDLLNIDEGVYIIALGGYGTNYGSYFFQLWCNEYSFPVFASEFNPLHTNVSELECDSRLLEEQNTHSHQISYYKLNITEEIHARLPISIWTCSLLYDTHIYIFTSLSHELEDKPTWHIITTSDDNPTCANPYDSKFTLSDPQIYSVGIYYIAVQGIGNTLGEFSIHMKCGSSPPTYSPSYYPTNNPSNYPTISPTEPAKIPTVLVMSLLFGAAAILIFLFIAYYLHIWRKYYKQKNDDKKSQQNTCDNITPQSTEDTETKQYNIVAENDHDDSDDGNTHYKDQDNSYDEKEQKEFDDEMSGFRTSIRGVTIRSLDEDKDIYEQLNDNQDVIQLMLAHFINCCEDKEGFDVYQLLSVRYYDDNATIIRANKPFKRIGINIEFVEIPQFVQIVMIVIITAITQTYGLMVVVFGLINAYFEDSVGDEVCVMDADRWNAVIHYKMLAFLLSLIVTFFISQMLTDIQHNGLYEMLDRLTLEHIKRVPGIALLMLQIGQGINYYVCIVASIGSYFIIFESNKGEETDNGTVDYSHAGLDMVLNAVALFFMLDMDDLLVSDDNYDDCKEHLMKVLNNYIPDVQINEEYKIEVSKENEPIGKRKLSVYASNIFTRNVCYSCTTTVIYYIIGIFSVFVTICCVGSGFIAPFIVFFCW